MGCSRARSGASLAVAGVLLAGVSARGDVILWTNPSGANWLNANNWNGTVVPDGDDTAQFGVDPTSSTTGLGINFNNTTNNGPGNQIVGAVQINSIRSNNLLIGNSSTTAGANGTFTLAGQTISGIPNTIIRHAGGTVAKPQHPHLPGLGTGLEWAFDSGTGVLSVIPEPAGAVFLSLVGLMLLRRRADGF